MSRTGQRATAESTTEPDPTSITFEFSIPSVFPDGDKEKHNCIYKTLAVHSIGAILLGDVNCDGVIDLLDVAPIVEVLTSGVFNSKVDIDQNDAVDLLDVAPFVALFSGG